jgi:hypothetical protein
MSPAQWRTLAPVTMAALEEELFMDAPEGPIHEAQNWSASRPSPCFAPLFD